MRYKSRFMQSRNRSVLLMNARKNAATLLIIAMFAAVIFSFGAIGDFMARKVFLPILGDPAKSALPSPTSTKEAESGKKTENVTVPELQLYLVQLGAFTNDETAQTGKNNAVSRGGAGYIIKEDNYFKVMASGYNTQEQAQSVVNQLQEQGIASKVCPVKSGSVVFKITAAQSQIKLINDAYNNYPVLCKDLTDKAIAMDKGEITNSAYRDLCKQLAEETANIRQNLENAAAGKTDNQILSALIELYKKTEVELDNISKLNSISDVAFSSKIKYNYIQLAMWYCEYITLVTGS